MSALTAVQERFVTAATGVAHAPIPLVWAMKNAGGRRGLTRSSFKSDSVANASISKSAVFARHKVLSGGRESAQKRVVRVWALSDLNQRPLRYERSALTGLS